jgi:GNAT superfamily N-acetyltransferase
MIEVINLANKPEHIKTIVDWLFSEWGNDNYEYWDSWVRSSMLNNGVPMTFIVVCDNELVGTFSLWRCDLQSRQDLFPWLGGIVVKEEWRRKGIGLFIQNKAKEILKNLGYDKAYLFTEMTGYYEKTGWEFIGIGIDERGNQVRIYKNNLTKI